MDSGLDFELDLDWTWTGLGLDLDWTWTGLGLDLDWTLDFIKRSLYLIDNITINHF